MMWSTVLPKYPTNTSLPMTNHSVDKEDHNGVVQIDPGGMMPSVLEVEELYEKGTKQLMIKSHLQPGVNMSSSSQCYSPAKEKYEYTTAMLFQVARVEISTHAVFA